MNQYPLIRGVNDLATTHPALCLEWDHERNEGITARDVSGGSTKKVWWRCGKGHSWQAVIYSRTGGTGCPYCSNSRILAGYNDLATLYPAVAAEWDDSKNAGVLPSEVASNTPKKFWWKCGKGHSWQAAISSRTAGKGCPYCANRMVLPGFNDLATLYPALAEEWDTAANNGIDPGQVLGGGHKKYWWKCSAGHSWQATVSNRIFGTGCPYCVGRKIQKGFNDLSSCRPDLLSEWDYEKNEGVYPESVGVGARTPIWWKCRHGHSWRTSVANRTRGGTGCPYCAGRKALTGENDFMTLHPELMSEWDHEKNIGVDPSRLVHQARKAVWWKCQKGHNWRAEIFSRVHGSGCPFCSAKQDKHRVIPGVNDLGTVRPDMAEQWDNLRNGDLTPSDILPNSNRAVWWKCKNGHHWRTSPNSRRNGSKCPYCAGKTPSRTRLV